MPTIAQFYGIIIRMFFNDHAPPHFHASYGEHELIRWHPTDSNARGARAAAGALDGA